MLDAAGFAIMDSSHEKQQMAAAFVLCDRVWQKYFEMFEAAGFVIIERFALKTIDG